MNDSPPPRPQRFYSRDLTRQAESPPLPPSARFESEVDRIMAAVQQRQSVVIVGPRGVGKTTLVTQVARRLCAQTTGDDPPAARRPLYESSCSQLLAGTRFLGDWETKVVRMVSVLKRRDALLYLTDLWSIVGAGAGNTNTKDLFTYLRPLVQNGQVVLIGEMTEERYHRTISREPAFGSLFSTVRLAQPSLERTRQILEFHARQAQERHRVEVGPVGLDRILAVSRRFVPYEVLPGKAVRLLGRVITEVAARQGRAVEPADVFDVFSRDTGLPRFIIDPAQTLDPDEAHGYFAARVLNQDEAVGRVVDSISMYKAQLNDPMRPIAVMFFVGPTGVGKTELAKAIAEYLFGSARRLIRLDMSEFSTADTLERLAGGQQWIEGGEVREGLLTGPVRQQPFSVVLLDEFEKAHPRVYDMMLQVFSEGRLTDARGETTDFRNTLFVLTSNLGSQKITGGLIGFSKARAAKRDALHGRVMKEMQSHFRPEFINRLDHVVVFDPLDEESARRIVGRELGRLHELAGLKNLDLSTQVDEGLVDLVMERGLDPRYGARPLKRALQELVLSPIARFLVRRPVAPGAIVRLGVKANAVVVSLVETAESEAARALSERLDVAAGSAAPLRLSLEEIGHSIGDLRGRLDRVAASYGLDEARARRADLDALQARPDFWDDPESARALYREMQRLGSDIGRMDKAAELARTVRDYCELSMLERDATLVREITGEYARLLTLIETIEHEMTLFGPDQRHDALLRIKSTSGDPEDDQWSRGLLGVYVGWARRHGYPVTSLYDPTLWRGRDAPAEILMLVEGNYAFGYLAGETGLHKCLTRTTSRRGEEIKTRVAQVGVWALAEPHEVAAAQLERSYVVVPRGSRGSTATCQILRRTGTGPALHLANALSAEANASLGRRILYSLDRTVHAPAQQDLVRTFDEAHHDVVKDRRTGHKVHGTKRVLSGELESFLLAYLTHRQEAASLAEETDEDRADLL